MKARRTPFPRAPLKGLTHRWHHRGVPATGYGFTSDGVPDLRFALEVHAVELHASDSAMEVAGQCWNLMQVIADKSNEELP